MISYQRIMNRALNYETVTHTDEAANQILIHITSYESGELERLGTAETFNVQKEFN